MTSSSASSVLDSMLEHWRSRPQDHLDNVGYASDPKADKLVRENLVAFLMASSIDRTGNSTLIWNIPYYLQQQWGHLDSAKIGKMDEEELAASPIIARAPGLASRRHLAKTIISLAQVIEDEHGGQPERLLDGSISDIMENLQHVFGVGPNIARMIVILRILYFGLKPAPGGRLLPKIDVHVQRVLTRAGVVPVCTEQALRPVLKDYSIEEIAIIDQVCWGLGQSCCMAKNPKCRECPIGFVCRKTSVN